ncbi:2-oxo-4-hydroxy-4-carboxy-5-ureidoimidazoline decarboxylase [Litchfieldia salsa]|uniref:2-oxo-4-hydroxy-4-carboxy-5-ureidoimidazoline decarboxylase n=1 Tax=Litchfieldia salsa TaxID=930152 RepID=A0A1H0U9R0_9BACI|nr:2-oxo-4-hydroxy-4-carboxy-5-ureidoimidazoline decarboxylase [Litchfieldia salsa]SDP62738.1 2-oxo-4-hydroxy-4-carboxy-5-ureidoimidazoline decarboxylase [Litchfieldia salsa]
MMNLTVLNGLTEDEFTETLGEIYEHSPWVAKQAAQYRPFETIDVLHQAMMEVVSNAPTEDKLMLIREHPNLGDKIEMSNDSTKEQHGAGLQNLTEEEFSQFQSLNKAYMQKFGFPFIFAVKGKNKQDVYESLLQRIEHIEAEEFTTALKEIDKIAGFRLRDKIIE